jgi:hypothetical protein
MDKKRKAEGHMITPTTAAGRSGRYRIPVDFLMKTLEIPIYLLTLLALLVSILGTFNLWKYSLINDNIQFIGAHSA